jgi:hypothetical protein
MEKPLTEEELKQFYAKATEHFQAVDPLIQVVLRGHLLLEERLNATLKHSLYNPELFEKMNLNFHHKLLFARAFSVSLRAEGVWDLIAAINALRNSIAHSLDGEQRQKKFDAVKTIYLRELDDPELRAEDRDEPDHLLFLKAFALCEGYLRQVEDDARFAGNGVRTVVRYMRKQFYQPDQK